MGHSHRAGSLRQSNKRNKRSSASKRSRNRSAGGKIAGNNRRGGPKVAATSSKADRMHMAKQRRDASKRTALDARRAGLTGSAASIGSATNDGRVPRVVGLISLSEIEGDLEETMRNFILKSADSIMTSSRDGKGDDGSGNGNGNGRSSVTAKIDAHKNQGYLTVLTNSTAFRPQYVRGIGDIEDAQQDASISAALDLCRVCDLVVFLLDGNDAVAPAGDGSRHEGGSVSVASSATNLNCDDLISERGDRVLSAIKAQGLPTPLTLLAHSERGDGDGDDDAMSLMSQSVKSTRRAALKRRVELKRYVNRFAMTEFGEGAKVAEVDIPEEDDEDEMDHDNQEGSTAMSSVRSKKTIPPSSASSRHPSAALVRMLCTMSACGPKWVADAARPYIISDGALNEGYTFDSEARELKVTGYIRGNNPLNANGLVHIPNVGTFAIKCVEEAVAPLTGIRKGDATKTDVTLEGARDALFLAVSNSASREPLEMFATPDALEGEQNLIGFDDDNHGGYEDDDNAVGMDQDLEAFKAGSARPAGWSDYQSAWLDAVDDEGEEDHGELAFSLNQKKKSCDASVATAGPMDLDEDEANDVTPEERRALLDQRRKDQRDDLEFPDEVEIKEDENARERYARYRSLKSFRKSFWDPKENLPVSYGAVYHFASFKATQRDVMADMKDVREAAARVPLNGQRKGLGDDGSDMRVDSDDRSSDEDELLESCVPSGSYVTMVVENVSPSTYARLSSKALVTAVCLLPHENKVSVLHMGLSQTSKCEQNDDVPVKSKDVLTVRCGWRTWQARPVFSQNNLNCDKHKFERFLPTRGAFFAATVFGPVTYTPCPVLVFRENCEKVNECQTRCRRELVAHGSMLGADADRIVVKRIVLTGYPTRVHKRHATVKYMFYNPEDVKWFKPAGLTTKHGLQGNIVESVGDHGTMKCLFNAPIKQHDTVCLPLYKRIFPKFAPTEITGDDGISVKKSELLVL